MASSLAGSKAMPASSPAMRSTVGTLRRPADRLLRLAHDRRPRPRNKSHRPHPTGALVTTTRRRTVSRHHRRLSRRLQRLRLADKSYGLLLDIKRRRTRQAQPLLQNNGHKSAATRISILGARKHGRNSRGWRAGKRRIRGTTSPMAKKPA